MRLVLLATVGVATACSYFAFAVPAYSTSPQNAMVLRSLHGQPVNVGAFTAVNETASLRCGSDGRVTTDVGEPYSQYIRAALISELQTAQLYDPKAAVTITGLVEHADFYSASRRWATTLTLSSSNGRRVDVTGSWYWHDTPTGRCQDAAAAFVPAVQDTISRIINDPSFAALLVAPSPAAPPSSAK